MASLLVRGSQSTPWLEDTADQVTNDVVANVNRRANRACRIGELELRRQERLSPNELAAIFRQWLTVLEKLLEPTVYFAVLPELRRVTVGRVQGS